MHVVTKNDKYRATAKMLKAPPTKIYIVLFRHINRPERLTCSQLVKLLTKRKNQTIDIKMFRWYRAIPSAEPLRYEVQRYSLLVL